MKSAFALLRGSDGERGDGGGESSRSSRRKKSSDDSLGDVGSTKSKGRKIKKMRMRLRGSKKKKRGEEESISERRGKRRTEDSFDNDDDFVENNGVGIGGGGGFQLDNVVPGGHNTHRKSREDERTSRISDTKGKKVRVKPFHAFPSPTYMTETELYNSMMSPSEEFEFLTSFLNPSTKATRRCKVTEPVRKFFGTPREDGRIGSLRVEVLGCVGLDRAKPEISAYLVVGDCAFTTDIIPGARSPMWPDCAKRAAVFPLHHAYAKMFVGIFDVKQRKNNEADHFCGRCTFDIPALRPDTEYDVTIPIRASSFIYDRRPRGVVRLRFSLHWFSERAAILSYLKRPRNPLAFSKQAKKQPTIPCGDPKTFRNVAVTVHGQDFPGKYTRGAFRATMREFNLYQQNIRFLAKVTILDCILYENPLMSIYLFATSMYGVWLNSVRYCPPFFIGWIIFLLLENYRVHCVEVAGHLGYKPPTIAEILYALLRDGKSKKSSLKPILVKKRPRRSVITEDGKTGDIEFANHREFPFSERFEYLKFAASEAIAPSPASKNKKGGKAQEEDTARRLSIFVAPMEDKDEASVEDSESESDEESEQAERDDEGMMDQADDGFENINDSDDEPEDEDDEDHVNHKKGRIFEAGKASTTRRIRVGPAQNSDKSGRKVPPQVHLSRVEHMLHRATKNISVEHVHFPPPHHQLTMGKDYNAKGPASDVITAKEKQNFDEFDKLLGFRTKNPNPILRITSSFLGPLMRMIRIVIYATRIAFNVTAWTDPFLTFWFFAFLSVVMFVLLIFPWRIFFFFMTILLLGPQNIAIRKYLEGRAKEKEVEEAEAKEREAQNAKFEAENNIAPSSLTRSTSEDTSASKKKSRWSRSRTSKGDEDGGPEPEDVTNDVFQSPRPAFYAHSRPTKRNVVPRDVAVPYFRFRKDRFYDWPPDPTVSRATPILQVEEDPDIDGSRHHKGRRNRDREPDEDFGYDEDDMADGYDEPEGMRQSSRGRY